MEKLKNYATPSLLLVLMFFSNFLDTSLFDFQSHNFTVWFVLCLFCFACGWYINKTLNWHFGGKTVFSLVLTAILLSVIIISLFKTFFNATAMIFDNIILYSLRNISLGAMAFFGMAISEILTRQKEYYITREKLALFENRFKEASSESELILKDAQIEAKRIITEAELSAKNIYLKKERIEKELKEFIQAEKELIKKYEDMG